ncbi:MAG: protease modulator HflK [Phycisphaerae bacterium]|nr:protease modulator HflK [Phycisphaerae bacterium]MDD5381386.1 protease modulator HflK [Phycisphaerae bacterium]
MTDDNNKHLIQPPGKAAGDELDAAGKSLSEALRISFIVLKIIMIVLIVVFLASGFRTVEPDEQALVLRFGKICGIGENRILGPGLKWVFPYPIDKIVKIPVAKKLNLPVDSFWYYQRPDELLLSPEVRKSRVPATLNPIREGYCIIRSEEQSQTIPGLTGSDYHIVHCKWQLTYQIGDPERFFKNTYTDDTSPGQNYADVIEKSIRPLLEDLFEDAVVTAMVNYTIDEAISSQDRIPKHVKKLLQEKLDHIESGIAVVSVQLTDITWPRQVDRAFLASIKASQDSQKTISEAKGYAENTLNEVAGPVAAQLFETLKNETTGEEEKELLWPQLAGQAQEKIAGARAYRTKVVETAKANAEYLQKLLPEYRKRPELVVQKIYQDAIEYILNNVDEKIIIQPDAGIKGREIRLLLNKDQTLKPKSEEK